MVGTQGSNPVSVPEAVRTLPFRGRRSRNKVSVGEPADGSFEETLSIGRDSLSPSFFQKDWGGRGHAPTPDRERKKSLPGGQVSKASLSKKKGGRRNKTIPGRHL